MKVSKNNLFRLCVMFCLIFLCIGTGLSFNPDPAISVLKNAQAKFNSGSYQDALTLFRNAKNINSSLIDAWYGEAKSDYMLGKRGDSGKYKDSDEICDKVLRDQSFQGIRSLDKFAELAANCTIEYKKATGRDLVNAIPGSPSDGNADAYQQAIGYYDIALKYNPNSSSAWNNKGVILAELNNFTGSKYCFDKALEINSSLAETWNNKGASLARLGLYEEALGCYDNATRLNPKLAEAWYNKVHTLSKLQEKAVKEVRKYEPGLFDRPSNQEILVEIQKPLN